MGGIELNQKKIIIPLPNYDFDPSEAAIPWKILTDKGFQVDFATPNGKIPFGDQMMLSGEGLDPWGWIPGLKKIPLIGLILRANKDARTAYSNMITDKRFHKPLAYSMLKVEDYDGMILPGGHASRVKPYLEDQTLRSFVVDFFESTNTTGQHKPVSAVCHGVLVAARAISPTTGHSVLYGKKTTALTWALESTAWYLTKYFARFWDPNYYRTYMEKKGEPKAHWSVEQEIKRLLRSPNDFLDVNKASPHYLYKSLGVARDSIDNSKAAWVVQDGNYFSGRWPGDVHTLTLKFAQAVENFSA
jgi:putative intracellular protease/amidase